MITKCSQWTMKLRFSYTVSHKARVYFTRSERKSVKVVIFVIKNSPVDNDSSRPSCPLVLACAAASCVAVQGSCPNAETGTKLRHALRPPFVVGSGSPKNNVTNMAEAISFGWFLFSCCRNNLCEQGILLLFIFLFNFSNLEILSPYRNPIRNRGVWTRVDILWVSHCSYVLIRQHVLSNLRFTYPTIFQRYVTLRSFTFLFPLLFGSVIKYNSFF